MGTESTHSEFLKFNSEHKLSPTVPNSDFVSVSVPPLCSSKILITQLKWKFPEIICRLLGVVNFFYLFIFKLHYHFIVRSAQFSSAQLSDAGNM